MVFLYPKVETASDCRSQANVCGDRFPCHRSNAMNGKTAFVLLSGVLSGSLCACVQPPAPAPAAPQPAPVAAPAPAPAPVAEPTPGDRWVSIRGATCERLLELSPDDRAAASLFCTGYQAARFGSRPSMWPRSPTPRSGRRATAQSILADRQSRRSGRLIDKPSDRAGHFSGVDHRTLGVVVTPALSSSLSR